MFLKQRCIIPSIFAPPAAAQCMLGYIADVRMSEGGDISGTVPIHTRCNRRAWAERKYRAEQQQIKVFAVQIYLCTTAGGLKLVLEPHANQLAS